MRSMSWILYAACAAYASAERDTVPVNAPVERQVVVMRHNVQISVDPSAIDPVGVATVGNGVFAMGLDLTGTQTFNSSYIYDLNALADWLTHTMPFVPSNRVEALQTFNHTEYATATSMAATRSVRYPTGNNETGNDAAGPWTHANPHKMNAWQISLRYVDASAPQLASSSQLRLTDLLGNSSQELDLWTATLTSNFSLNHTNSNTSSCIRASTTSTVHPSIDSFAVRLTGAPCASSSYPSTVLGMRLSFPYATGAFGPSVSAWDPAYDEAHVTTVVANQSTQEAGYVILARRVDADSYSVRCDWNSSSGNGTSLSYSSSQNIQWSLVRTGLHTFDFVPAFPLLQDYVLDWRCMAAPWDLHYPVAPWLPWLETKANLTGAALQSGTPSFPSTIDAAAAEFSSFWLGGAFVDIASRTSDPRAWELERRVILSQYLMRVHSAGATPPQETGLLCNSWSGKFHLEMRFWHHSHWPLWNRLNLLQRSDGFYVEELPNATSTAEFQGYKGARWPKMVEPCGNRSGIDVSWLGLDYAPYPFKGGNNTQHPLYLWESASGVGPLLVWQQPHVIWMAEVQRRVANATLGPQAAAAVVAFQQQLVDATADFLSSFPYWNASDAHYWMGPPLYGGEESGNPLSIQNPTFELVYFGWGLDTANEWRKQAGEPVNPAWDSVASQLARPYVDPASPADQPEYSFNYDCACAYIIPGTEGCPPGRFGGKSSCSACASHPMPVGVLGMVNGLAFGPDRYGINITTLNNTIAAVVANWTWGNETVGANVWGWDFPLVALSQARLGWSPDAIVDMLLLPVLKNLYTQFGYNYQTPTLPAYMPGNGGLLLAVAALAAGFDGELPSSSFPPEWQVAVEGFPIQYP